MSVIDNAIYIDGKRAIVPESLDQTFEELRSCTDTAGHSFCWIGLLRPSKPEIDAVAAEFDLHGLAVEDTIKAHQRPKWNATARCSSSCCARRVTSTPRRS